MNLLNINISKMSIGELKELRQTVNQRVVALLNTKNSDDPSWQTNKGNFAYNQQLRNEIVINN